MKGIYKEILDGDPVDAESNVIQLNDKWSLKDLIKVVGDLLEEYQVNVEPVSVPDAEICYGNIRRALDLINKRIHP